jgi:hypothetical protein
MFMNKYIVLSLCFIAFLFFSGCTVSEKTIKNAEDRLNKLSEKGVPETAILHWPESRWIRCNTILQKVKINTN